MAKVLVTGGAGFIGSHLSRDLLAEGYDVVVFDDLSGGFFDNVPSQCEFVKGSVCDRHAVAQLFSDHSFKYVFHLAAYAAEGLSHFIKNFNYMNNLIGSVNLINESIKTGVECFVFTSSIAVYGEAVPPMTEEVRPSPVDPYGVAKYAVEMELSVSNKMFGLPYIIFRPHNVYGEYQNIGDRYRNVIGIFMNQIMQGKPVTIFGDGSQTRAFSYIADVSPLIAKSVRSGDMYNQVFNVGGDEVYSVNQLAAAVAKSMGKPLEVKYLKKRDEVLAAFCEHEKIKKYFPGRQNVSLSEGLGRMARWAYSVGPRKSTEFCDIEIWDNLPEGWSPSVNKG